jgi:PAS domain S-box-containing protein
VTFVSLPAPKKLVLVVDDDPSARLLAASTLGNAGYRVEEAVNGKDALSAFARVHPDVVLLDVMMPEMDGFTACRELRKAPGGRHVPIMMMTGLEDVDAIHRAYEAGATDFITKPINWVILGYRVAYLGRAAETFDELFRSERKNRALLNAIPDIVFRIGRDGAFLDVVSSNDQDLLLPRDAFVGRDVADVLPADLAERTRDRIADTLRTKEVQRLEYSLPMRGEDAFFEARYIPNGDDEVLAIIRNITERKIAERQALFHSRRMDLMNRICTAALQESGIQEALATMSRDIRELLDLAGCAIRVFGERGILVEDHDPSWSFPAPMAACISTNQGGALPCVGERKIVNDLRKEGTCGANGAADGSFLGFPLEHQGAVFGRLHLVHAQPHHWSQDELVLGEAISRQVALAVRHTQLFHDQQEVAGRLLSVLNNLPGVIYRGLPDWSVAFIGGAQAERFSGYTQEELNSPSFSFIAHVHPGCREPLVRTVTEAVKAGAESLRLEYRLRHKSGEYRWVSDHRRLAYDDRGFLTHVDGLVQDTHDRRVAEEARARLEMAVEQAGESIVITDTDGRIEYVNPAFERISGYSRTEAIGRSTDFLKHEASDPALYQQLRTAMGNEQDWTGLIVNRRKDGTLYEEEAVISPVRDSSGHVVNFVAVKRDVTNERMMEEQLRQAQKMEAVGRLAGGVAHDFNNILTAILGYTDLLLTRAPEADPVRRGLLEIRNAGDRAANLTRQLLAFSRRQVLQPKVTNLNEVVTGIDRLLRRLIGEHIYIRTHLTERLGNVKIDPGQIEQVVVNLAVNARDAMPNGGTLTFETANVEHGEGYALRHRSIRPGRYVMLAITDQGTGMDEATRSRIFEPFFTTKEKGKGTGLGLATVYGIVNQSGGHIWVYSEPGQGTTFKIYLPRVDEAADVAARDDAAPEGGRGETVLLVEDDLAVRNITRTILCDRGYTVLEAADGEEGLEVARTHSGRIDLVLTDVVMPAMGGLEMVEKLTVLRPDSKTLLMSGYPENAAQQNGTLASGTSFLMKPFRAETLLHKVRSVLDSCNA